MFEKSVYIYIYIFSDCQPLVFWKTTNLSFCIGLYLLPIKRNIKILISSYTSASSYDPIVASYLLLFPIHCSPSFYKRDLLSWKIVSLFLGAIVTCWGRSPLCQTLEIRVNYYLNAFWYVCINIIGSIIIFFYSMHQISHSLRYFLPLMMLISTKLTITMFMYFSCERVSKSKHMTRIFFWFI